METTATAISVRVARAGPTPPSQANLTLLLPAHETRAVTLEGARIEQDGPLEGQRRLVLSFD
uniref:Uncharacterized protein n=1 Tax=Phenylobacterium glaciei TaxID=2803784 RepID=A0A974P2L9_9CAUL|nr:hypothetical protein JKL49_19280 [Phenylobacterium glaciei]